MDELVAAADGVAGPAGTRIGRLSSSPGVADAVAAGRAGSGWETAEAKRPPPTAVTPSAAAANQVSLGKERFETVRGMGYRLV